MHSQELLIGLSSVIIIGVLVQWVAWRFKLPSILLLLIAGFIAGPITGFLNPDELFGDLLTPLVSLSVGIILFEGGLTLELRELRSIGNVVRNLVSIGALITWLLVTLVARFVLGLDLGIAALLGAILVVTGPTVIGPLLRFMGPIGRTGSILKWEGIVIDPIGATLSVLVFEALVAQNVGEGLSVVIGSIMKTVLIGGGFGLLGALIMIGMLRRDWIPESLDVPFTLAMVVAVFTASNLFQAESGLFATTVMGITLANQRFFAVKHILEFKENLRVLLIAALFILLSARLPLDQVIDAALNWHTWLFIALLMLVVRPLTVAVSTFRSNLTLQERALLAWMAPRGIVAASISSIFALDLANEGFQQASQLVPMTFITIIATVTIYGLTAAPLARRLGLTNGQPQGLLVIGAHTWAREIAAAVQAAGFRVLMADSNRGNIRNAQMQNLDTFYGNALSDGADDILDLEDIGQLVALTPNEEINALASIHFAETFGDDGVYQLSSQANSTRRADEAPARELRGQALGGNDITYRQLDRMFTEGAVVKRTKITAQFSYEQLIETYEGEFIPLFVVTEDDKLTVLSEASSDPQVGQAVIFVAKPLQPQGEDSEAAPPNVASATVAGKAQASA